MKTKKSFAKRMKLTRTGKIIARRPGQNHFNAKERSGANGLKHRTQAIRIKNKARSRMLVNM